MPQNHQIAKKQTCYLTLFACAFILLIQLPANAQQEYYWKVIGGFENNLLRDIDCADSTDCMMASIVGLGFVSSIVYHSTDAGSTWAKSFEDSVISEPVLDSPLKIYTIQHPTRQLALVGADSGIILRTSNGGTTWNRMQVAGTRNSCERLSMYDGNHGIAAFFGPGLPIMATTDGGASWKELTLPVPEEPGWDTLTKYAAYTVECIAPYTYFCVRRGPRTHTLFRTSDGGRNWTRLSSLFGPDYDTIRLGHTYFSFVDTLNGFVASSVALRPVQPGVPIHTVIARTSDGGQSWQVVFRDSLNGPSVGETPVKIVFRDTLEGVLPGFYPVFSTIDGGRSWRIDSTEINSVLNGVAIFKKGKPELLMTHSDQVLRRISLTSSVRGADSRNADYHIIAVNFDGNSLLVKYYLQTSRHIRMELFDLLGRTVASRFEEKLTSGPHQGQLNLTGISSGTYILRLDDGRQQQTASIVLTR